MDLTSLFQSFMAPELFPTLPSALFAIGIFIKSSKKISSHLIPIILVIVGATIAMFIQVTTYGIIWSVQSVLLLFIQNLGSGAVSAFISIGMYQLLSQSGITLGVNGYDSRPHTSVTVTTDVAPPTLVQDMSVDVTNITHESGM